ncbi:MAG TPA: protease inhibitor I42 family protein [Dehalococcoidia bacterium]|jgi:predicted secreted protein
MEAHAILARRSRLGRVCAFTVVCVLLALVARPAPRLVVAQMANGCDSPTDPSVPIEVRAGQAVTIALAGNATTGYSWLLAQPPDPAVLQVWQAMYIAPSDNPTVLGQGGISCWMFWAAGSGETMAGFEYRRPFELDQAPANVASFYVIVDSGQ